MIGQTTALIVMVLYLIFLFWVARYAIRMRQEGRSIVSNPYVYALSISIYVSAWTFYGSIGRAASPASGLAFIPIYLGPTLAMLLGWTLVRKMVRVSKEFHLTSISDFISFRYGRSYAIGAIVAAACLLMDVPYVALQLNAISASLVILSETNLSLIFNGWRRLLVAVLMGLFAVTFGARQLDPTDRHEGLVAIVAFESIVKLAAFLSVGLYVTYGLFGGYGDIAMGLSSFAQANPDYAGLTQVNYTSWFSLTMVAFFSSLLMPRMFHVIAVENSDESHIRRAMWFFPLYLILINLFVPAIAWAGLMLGTPGPADAFIISIPYSHGQDLLALFVFIGGVSASTSMILVSSVAVGAMMLNNLEMPFLLKHLGKSRSLPGLLLNVRRMNILLVVALGYLYSLIVAYKNLADIGTVSFIAASQFAPAAIGGLYWKRGSRQGAMAGLVSGIVLWFYTALVPVLAGSGILPGSIVTNGPFGIAFLRPTLLFGLDLDIWTHSAFWSLFTNISLYVLVSLFYRPSASEADSASGFVDIFKEKVAAAAAPVPEEQRPVHVGTVDELEQTLARFIGEESAKNLVDSELSKLNTTRRSIDALHLQKLWDQFERTLTGSLGSSATRMIVEESIPVKPVVEASKATKPAYHLEPGRIYLIPEKAFQVFTDQITHGIEGLCITFQEPEEVKSRWGFKETPVVRLSSDEGAGRHIPPTNLHQILTTIRSFIESSKNSIVLLDSVEFLVKECRGEVSMKEVLDFVYGLELLSKDTRLVLAERPQFVHRALSSEINELKELIFSLGHLSLYLFRLFSDSMLSGLDPASRESVIRDANEVIESGNFFEILKGDSSPPEKSEAGCDPDMVPEKRLDSLNIPDCLLLTRREFFLSIRHLSLIIKKYDPKFDMMASLGELMRSYGRSPYELMLIPGTTYVIEGEKPTRSMEIFSELIGHGMEGLCVSRYNPEILHERYGIPIENVVWLTQKSESKYLSVDHTNFPRLSNMLSEFLQKASYPVVLFEGLGYLITQSNYETVLRFIQSQRDDIALRNAVLLVHIDPLSLETKELHRLENEMEPLDTSCC